jgi:hypothetical protein
MPISPHCNSLSFVLFAGVPAAAGAPLGDTPSSRNFSGDFHTLPQNAHFSSVFCDYRLRSLISLAIVPSGPSFSAENMG